MTEIIALAAGVLAAVIVAAYLMINQRSRVKEWLKFAVAEAEKQLGGGTGQLKLRLVYDWFTGMFPVAAAFLPFGVFSAWVDAALDTVNRWLGESVGTAEYIGGE